MISQSNKRLAINSIGKNLDDKINEIRTTYTKLKQQIDAYLASAKYTKNATVNYLQQIVNLNKTINSIKLDLLKDFITKANDFASHSDTPVVGQSNRNAVFDLLKELLKSYNETLGNLVIGVYDTNALAAGGGGGAVQSASADQTRELRTAIGAELAREDPIIPQTFIGWVRSNAPQPQPPNPKEATRRTDITNTMMRALLELENLKNTTLAAGGARVFNTAPILSVRDAQNKIIGFKGQVAVGNELNTYQEQLREYYTNLNNQQNLGSPVTDDSNKASPTLSEKTATPNIPNRIVNFNTNPNQELSKRGTIRRSAGDLRRSTLGFGGRQTKKRRYSRRNRNRNRKRNRKTNRHIRRK